MSGEFEARLRRHLAAADDVEVGPASAVMASAEQVNRRAQRRRRAATGTLSVVMLVGALVVLTGRPGGGDDLGPSAADDHADDTVEQPDAAAADESAGTSPSSAEPDRDGTPGADPAVDEDDGRSTRSAWSALPPDPAGARASPQAVWTGAEVIALYGTDLDGQPRTDISSYVPATGQWRDVSPPPLDGPMAELHTDPLVVWTGGEMLVIGGRAGGDVGRAVGFGALAYEPHRDTWRPIAGPAGHVDATHPWAWAGDELLVWSTHGPSAYRPADDEWRDLADPPVPARTHAASVWTGDEWIVWGGTHAGQGHADGAAYDPATDTWRPIAASPLSARRPPAVWTGSEMIVASGASGGERVPDALSDGAAYDPASDTWRPIADGFAHPGFVPIWTGTHLVMFAKGAAAVYDPEGDTWVDHCCNETGGGPGGTPVWTGTSIVLVGSHRADAGGSVFTVRAADAPDDPTIPVEIAVARPEVSTIDTITARIPDDAFETPHNPARLTAPDEAPDHSPGLVYVNTWNAASCDCQLGLAVMEDFGDDAPLYGHLADAERIASDLGVWMLMVGEHPREPTIAILRIDGLVIQASTVDGSIDVLRALIDTIAVDHP